jgi:hypothetical protein
MSFNEYGIRIVEGSTPVTWVDGAKSETDQTREMILERAQAKASEAHAALSEAVNWLAIIAPSSKNEGLPRLIARLVEEIEELAWSR